METPLNVFAGFRRGLSETTAIAVLLGLAIALSISFAVYMYSDYAVRQDAMLIKRVIESEKANTVVRLILPEEGGGSDTHALLLRRLDGGDKVYLFLSNGTNYVSCGNAVEIVPDGGGPVETYVHDVSKIMVVSREGIYSYKHYARARGYPDSGLVEVCAIELNRNTVVLIRLASEGEPIAIGYNSTLVEANGRSWRLYGAVEFNISSSRADLYVNNTWYQLNKGDTVRVYVDTVTGKIDLARTGGVGARVQEFNVFAKEVRVNGALLAKNVWVRIAGNADTDLRSLRSTLAIEILPTPSGFTRVVHGGRTVVEHWNNSDYIRVVGWSLNPDMGPQRLILELTSSSLYAQGLANAIYVGDLRLDPVNRLIVFIVTYVNNVPYLVDVYDYKFS